MGGVRHHRTIRRAGIAGRGLGQSRSAGECEQHRRDEREQGGPMAQKAVLSAGENDP